MKEKRLQIMAVGMIVLSAIASLVGIFSNNRTSYPDICTVFGETVKLYNKGIYARNSISMASQAIAQDMITLLVGIPIILLSLLLIRRKKSKGIFLYTGIMGYFLYTYASYAFLMIYNQLYLIYVALMALGFYSFIGGLFAIREKKTVEYFTEKFPAKSLSTFLFVTGSVIGLLWLSKVIPTIPNGSAPAELEHYATIVIQSLDLGVVVPACIVTGVLLRKRNEWGYILSVVLVVKGVTMTAAVSAMAMFMKFSGMTISIVEMLVFPILCCMSGYFMIKLVQEIK